MISSFDKEQLNWLKKACIYAMGNGDVKTVDFGIPILHKLKKLSDSFDHQK